jgi:hypothetical protein
MRSSAPQSGEISLKINDAEVASDKRSGGMHVLIHQVAPPVLQQPDGTATIYAVVDVRDELHVTADGIYWEYGGKGGHVGRLDGNYPTLINGVYWWPKWEKPEQSDMLATADLWPARVEQFKLLAVDAHRGHVALLASNKSEIRLEFRDGGPGASHVGCKVLVGKP